MSVGRYQAYPEYKDSGVNWLGEIPNHWTIVPLKYLASFSGGGTPSKDNTAFWNGDIPWVSPKDMKGRFVDRTIDNITAKAVEQSSTNLLKEGALLIVVRSGILQHSIPAAINRVPVALNQDMKALRFNEQMHVEFAQYFVIGNQRPLLLEWCKEGATVESIEQEYLGISRTPIPPLPEQTQIAAFLDHETAKIDRLIEKQQALISLLKEKRQAVISHAVTKGLNPHAPLKDSGIEWLGQVPAHWTVTTLKYLVAIPIIDGPHESPIRCDDGIPFVSAEALSGGTVDFDKKWGYISPREHRRFSQRFSPLRGDIFMVKLGATTGAVGIVETDEVFNIWVPLAAIRLIQSIEPRYIFHFLKSESAQDAVRLSWTYGTQQTLGLKTLSNFRIPVPPKEERVRIIDYIDSKIPLFDNSIEKATASIALMQERRTALISAAVTGKIDVRSYK